MQVSEVFAMTSGLLKLSQMLPEVISSFNRNNASSMGIITHDPSYGLSPNEDRLEYWDDSGRYIAFGRYLLFKKNKMEEIKFWIGFCLESTKRNYGIWFDKKYLSTYYVKKLKKKFHSEKFDTEVWIKNMDFNDFSDDSICSMSQTIGKLLHSVLRELK